MWNFRYSTQFIVLYTHHKSTTIFVKIMLHKIKVQVQVMDHQFNIASSRHGKFPTLQGVNLFSWNVRSKDSQGPKMFDLYMHNADKWSINLPFWGHPSYTEVWEVCHIVHIVIYELMDTILNLILSHWDPKNSMLSQWELLHSIVTG